MNNPPPAARAKRPNHLRVLLVAAVIGFAVGGFLGLSGDTAESSRVQDGQYSAPTAVGYLGLLGAMVFALIAGAVSVAIESFRERRSR